MTERVTQIHNNLELTQPPFFSEAACALAGNDDLFQETITQEIERDEIEQSLVKKARDICFFSCTVLPECYEYFLYEDGAGVRGGQISREWDNDRKNQGIKVRRKTTVRGRK